ncbi:metallophosphoesterase [Fulvivirgaceae bacterium BMA12]|uniref:Metallophosphoesterase n=1 Tax=Agaribacillus aureus TaxID=3051825 RepID=A0ABT8LAB3_9BACT|nr:metallophosphoesterase [Fulvivirgaceae bacterium BMA12]
MNWKISRRKFITLSGSAAGMFMLPPGMIEGDHRSTVRFGIITDSHYADCDHAGTRYYRDSLEKMRVCIDVFNKEKIDFAIHLGDFKDQDPNKRTEDTLSYLKAIETVFARFKGPRFHCVGNHDVDSITKRQFLQHVENTGIANDQSYYSFDQSGFHFVVLDANYHKNGKPHFYKEGADWQDTNIPEEQLQWLRADLTKTILPTIVFCHHPLFEYIRHDHKYHVNNFEAIQGILEASKKVKAAIHGHVHEERFQQIKGIQYITQLGMVDYQGLENNSFAIVTCTGNEILLDGYKRTTDKTFPLIH